MTSTQKAAQRRLDLRARVIRLRKTERGLEIEHDRQENKRRRMKERNARAAAAGGPKPFSVDKLDRQSGVVRELTEKENAVQAKRIQAEEELKLFDFTVSRSNSTSQAISKAATFVKPREGWFPRPYTDPAGFSTVGYGHLIAYRPVNESDRRAIWVSGQKQRGVLTEPEGVRLLESDLKPAFDAIDAYVKVPLNVNERASLGSFIFNVGSGAFKSSTLLAKLNRGDRRGAADEFMRWVRGGGQVLPGLVSRRRAEQQLFLEKP